MQLLFLNIRLEAVSLYELIVIWTEMNLTVKADGNATLTGNGFAPDIVWALNTLIPEWKASMHLTMPPHGLVPGIYPIIHTEDQFYVIRKRVKYLLQEQAVLVEVIPADMEDW